MKLQILRLLNPAKTGTLTPQQKERLEELIYNEEINGERRVNRILLFVIGFITCMLGFLSIFVGVNPNMIPNLICFAIAIAYAVAIFVCLKKGIYRPFVKYLTISILVSILTFTVAGYSVSSGWVHSLRTVTLVIYFVVISLSGFYQNPRVSIFAGFLAAFEYALLFLYAVFFTEIPMTSLETFKAQVISYDLLLVYFFMLSFSGIITSLIARRLRIVVEKSLHFEAEVHLKNELEAANKKLEDMDKYKTRFFQNITHEFRTPLTLILGPLEALISAGASLPKDALVTLMTIKSNAGRLLHLINQLLDISKLDADRMALRIRRTNLSRFIGYLASAFESRVKEKQIDFKVAYDNRDLEAFVDREKIEKILFNLLSNAFKFTGSGGVISLSVREDCGRAEITVSDSGCGISALELPFVFDRFRQADGSSTRKRGGTGIGLALAKEYAELHHGAIRVSSKPGEGSEFTLSIPISGMEYLPSEIDVSGNQAEGSFSEQGQTGFNIDSYIEPDIDATDEEEAETEVQVGKGGTILVVEDNPSMRRFIRGVLSSDYEVHTAVDGTSGLEKAKSLKPDLVISDIMMPGMDGNLLLEELKKSEGTSSIPVILLTAKASDDFKVKGLRAGADDYLAKPFNPKELLARMGNILRLQAQKRELADLNARLMESEQMKDLLSGAVVHDIKNYASAIEISMKFLLAQYSGDRRILRNINAAKAACEDIIHLAINLIDIRKSEEGKLEIKRKLLSAQEIMAMTSKYAASPVFDEKQIKVEIEKPQAHFAIEADPMLFDRVLGNLFDNAHKYTHPGGKVSIGFESSPDESVIRIFNSGDEIPQEQKEALFEKYVRLDKRRSRYSKGLGLYFCSMIMEAHGGRVWCEPAVDGNVFLLGFRKSLMTQAA